MPIKHIGHAANIYNVVAIYLQWYMSHMCTVTLGVEIWFETQLQKHLNICELITIG